MSNKKYPFKHLSAYGRDDKTFYFGRKKETADLYKMTFETDLILLYGVSGVGKSSLIGCGLANKFEDYEWCKISVSRESNFNKSLLTKLKSRTNNDSDNISEQMKALRDIEFRPVYLIFDQFEEIFISGDTDKDEQPKFYSAVKQILALNQPVKIIISIREEYLAHLYDFEKAVPQLFSHKCWVQPSKETDKFSIIDEILQGVINNAAKSRVRIHDKEKLSVGIKRMFLNAGAKTVDLPSLQILFDEFYFALTGHKNYETEDAVFDADKLESVLQKNIKDIVFEYLERLIKKLIKEKHCEESRVWGFLLELITDKGTKQNVSEDLLINHLHYAKTDIKTITDFFKENNILNEAIHDNTRSWELRHDALAKCILDKSDSEMRLKNVIRQKMRDESHKDYLTEFQLKEIDKFHNRLILREQEKIWVEKNRKRINCKKYGIFALIAFLFLVLSFTVKWRTNEYYTDYVKDSNKKIQGIFPINDTILPHRNFKYHFIYSTTVWNKKLEKIIYEDKDGKPHEHPKAEFLDRKGKAIIEFIDNNMIIRNESGVIIESSKDTTNAKANVNINTFPKTFKGEFVPDEIINKYIVFDSLGRYKTVQYKTGEDRVLEPNNIWEINFEYDSWGNLSQITKKVYFDILYHDDWMTEIDETDSYGNINKKTFIYNKLPMKVYKYDNERETEIIDYNLFGEKPELNSRMQFLYNKDSLVSEIIRYDANDNISSKETYSYDYKGNILRTSYFNKKSQPAKIVTAANYAKNILVSEENDGNANFYVKDGERVVRKTEVMERNKYRPIGQMLTRNDITIDFVYDKSDMLTEKTYTGKEGKLKIDDYIVARERQENENGNKIREYFKTENNPCLSKDDDYLRITEKYDTLGNITHITYIKAEGDTCFCHDTYGFYKYQYDEHGRAIEQARFGANNNPVLSDDGYFKVKTQYDEDGNVIEQAYFGTDEKPVISRYGYAKQKMKYDKNRRVLEHALFGIDGNLVFVEEKGYAKTTTKFDKYGKNIEGAYFGADGKLFFAKEQGFAKYKYRYDKYGNQITYAYYDENGRLCCNAIGGTGAVKKMWRVFNKEKEVVRYVAIFDREQFENGKNIKKIELFGHFALWRNGFMTKDSVYNFYIETKYEIIIYTLIIVGIICGFIFRYKKRRFLKRLCWGIVGTTVLVFVVLYGYLLLM